MQYQLQNGESVSYWDPLDSIVLKAMAHVLTPLLNERMNLSAATHLKGHGGLKQAVVKTEQLSHNNTFVLKTDISDRLFWFQVKKTKTGLFLNSEDEVSEA